MKIKEKIKRSSLLYKTGVEYGDYTINHIQGCAHGCKYPCYAMSMAKRFGKAKTYEEWCEPKLAENALEILDIEIPKLKDKIESVHLCFTSDPFMYGYDEVADMSIAIIKKLNAAGIKCTVLTKGILPLALADLSPENEYGITLVSLDEDFRKEMEPNTAPFEERIQALKALHDAGCKTWVSMEPYPTPNFIEQDLETILEAIDRLVVHYNELLSGEEKRNFEIETDELIKFFKENVRAVINKNWLIPESV